MTAEEIAAGLTKAQRRWLTAEASMERICSGAPRRLTTFPPRATHDALIRFGLVDAIGNITRDGLEVRAILQKESSQ